MEQEKWIRIHPDDNVIVALQPLKAGTVIELSQPDASVTLLQDIPQGHKAAIQPIAKSENVIKYGQPIGQAREDIPAGGWIHTHNIKTNLGDILEYTYQPHNEPLKEREHKTFMGYPSKTGKTGIRNEIWIIPTVGCVNSIAKTLEKEANAQNWQGVEGVWAFNHPYGCSQMGMDQDNTRQILADLISHPNAGGVLVLGLGCENSGIDTIRPLLKNVDEERIEYLICQDHDDELEAGMEALARLAEKMKDDKREPIDASELIIGLKCGGSDGLSGITANPVVGEFSDKLVAQDGTTILTEVPEMFGGEALLMNRAENEEIFHQTVDLINNFKDYFTSHNQTIYENPSPGNKKGGISTLEDKSLGCIQKSGSAPVSGVLKYGEQVENKGLNLLSAPGNDLVASTALASSGAHMVLFTTGRGTPFASPVPTVKIASNSNLAKRKANWIDFNAGELLEGYTMDEMSDKLLDTVLEIASGKETKAEQAGYRDMAIFKQGVTL